MNDIKIFAFADEAGGLIDQQINAMKRNGLNGVELRGTEFGNVSDLTADQAKEIRKKLDDNGLCVWSAGSPIGKIDIVNDDFRAHLDKFKHTLDVSGILGAENMRVFSFYVPGADKAAEYKNEVIYRLSLMTELAEPYGVTLCHENEKGIYGDIGSRCLEILQEVPSLKAVFDPANFVQSGEDTLNAWSMIKDYVKYMHIKDALTDGRVVPAGKGDGNVEKIVREFVAMGGRDFTIEPHLTVFKGLEALERAGEESKVGELYTYPDSNAAFDAACQAFKEILSKL